MQVRVRKNLMLAMFSAIAIAMVLVQCCSYWRAYQVRWQHFSRFRASGIAVAVESGRAIIFWGGVDFDDAAAARAIANNSQHGFQLNSWAARRPDAGATFWSRLGFSMVMFSQIAKVGPAAGRPAVARILTFPIWVPSLLVLILIVIAFRRNNRWRSRGFDALHANGQHEAGPVMDGSAKT